MKIKIGDYVKTSKHGYIGRAYKFERLTNADSDWVAAQSIPVTIEQIQEKWVGIAIHGGGSVLVPLSTCSIIPPIENFSNPWIKEYFK